MDKNSDNSSGTPKCLQNVKTDLKPVSKAQATFQDGSNGLPTFGEYLSYLPGQGQHAMAVISQVLGKCGKISMTSGGQTVTGTIGAMSFPPVGDQSSAYQVNVSATASGVSITAGIDLVAIRKGDTVAILLYADLGTPDVQAVQQLAQDAAAKLS